MQKSKDEEIKKIANSLAAQLESDIVSFNGEISQNSCHLFKQQCLKNRSHKNVFLILVTPGGDPDAAFKIARVLQEKYDRISIFITGWCKSAGTLVALSANELYIGDYGEMGPLDIQIAKKDEIAEMGSGLTVDAALKSLETTASKMFINLVLSIRRDTGGMVLTRTASELAATMVTKLLEPIYSQIDPLRIGENSRAMNITKNYGTRLARKSGNLISPKTLDFLVSSYPDHGFVIDRQEAKALFKNVPQPTEPMIGLADLMGDAALVPQNIAGDGKAKIEYLSTGASGVPRSMDNVEQKSAGAGKRPRAAPQGRNGKPAGSAGV